MGAGIGVGIALGVPIGLTMDNLGVGIAIGLALGAGIGAAMERRAAGEVEVPEASRRRLLVAAILGTLLLAVAVVLTYLLVADKL
jgi:hypothetical protein